MPNRLYHVNDAVATGLASNEDISDPGYIFTNNDLTVNIANNFSYDEIGNLKRDSSEGIKHIEWTVTGKVKSITRYDGFSKIVNSVTIYPSDLEFLYDATGNRIAKIKKTRDENGLKSSADWITTYYTRNAQGNIMSVYKLSSEAQQTSFVQAEVGIYGSSMLGIYKPETELISAIPQTDIYSNYLGKKHFTGNNHLGNTIAVFSDIKHQSDYNTDDIVDSYTADLLAVNDYAPFGGLLTERTFNKGTFPNTFNGKRDDSELSDWQDYGMRMYSPWTRRFPTVDPIAKAYPELTTYQFAGNTPVWGVDWDGEEVRIYVVAGNYIKANVGHTFITVGNKDNVVVYTYGIYDDVDKEKGSLNETNISGEGVLIRLTGKKANQFINKYITLYGAQAYELTDIDEVGEQKVKNFFDNQFNSSNKIPDNSKGEYYKDSDARVIDDYNLINNNCTTISTEGAKAGGTKAFNYSVDIPFNPVGPSGGYNLITEQSPFTPLGIKNYLENKSKENDSTVKNVTNQISTGGAGGTW